MQMTMIEALNSALSLELERDKRVVVLGQDIGANGGVFRVTEHLQQKFGEKRVFDTPLSESAIIGSSVGMAIYGLRPIAEIQFAGFLFVSMNQLVSQAARIRFRSAGAYTCPLVVRAPYGGGVRTPELHSDSLEGVFLQTPGLKIVMPTVWPLDEEAMPNSVEKAGRAIIVPEAPRAGGIGAEITAVINERCFYSLLKPLGRVTGYDTPFPVPGQEDYYLPTPAKVMTVLREIMEP